MTDLDHLIDRLASDARPVTPLRSPLVRTLAWLMVAAAFVAIAVLAHGLRPGLADALASPGMRAEFIAGIATGVLAAYAVFQISVPGRSSAWAWLPAPALVAWLSALSWSCVEQYGRLGSAALAFAMDTWECAAAITGISLPLGLVMLVMVRHAGVILPARTAMLAALSAAALSASGVTLVHAGDTALMALVWHLGAVALLSAGSWLLGRSMFGWIGHAKR